MKNAKSLEHFNLHQTTYFPEDHFHEYLGDSIAKWRVYVSVLTVEAFESVTDEFQ